MRREDDKQFALECLKLANGEIEQAAKLLAFVTGEDVQTAQSQREARIMAYQEDF